MNNISTALFSLFIFFSVLGISQKIRAMEEDAFDSTVASPSLPFSSSEEQFLSEEMEREVSQEIVRCQRLIPYINRKLRSVDDNLDELLKRAKIFGFSGVPVPHVLLDATSLRQYAIDLVKARKRKRVAEEEKENKPETNVIKRTKVQETTMPPLQDETIIPSLKNLLEKK